MTELEYQRTFERIEYQILAAIGKVCLMGFGVMLIVIGFYERKTPMAWLPMLFGGGLLVLAVIWIFTDKRVITQEEELENLLIQASKKLRKVGSVSRLLDDYRANGAEELTLSRIRGAPRLLRERGRNKIRSGIVFSAAGLILACGAITLIIWREGAVYAHLLKYGTLGAGLGIAYIVNGFRFKWYARRFARYSSPRARPM